MSGRQISWATLTLVGVAGFIAGFGVIAAWSGQVPGTVRQAPIRTVIVGAGVDAGEGDNPVPEPIPTAAGVARAEAPLEAIPTGLPVSPATSSPAPAAERAAAPAPPTAPKPAAASGPAVATAPAPGPGPEPKAPAASVATGAKSDAPSSLGESDAPSSPPSLGGSSPASSASSASSVPSPAGGALAPSLEKSWWLQAKGRPCHLTFGTHPGLNVRSGSLTDGKVVRWRDYSRNKAIARLVKHRNPVVTPVAFGFTKKGGPPLAVQIQFDHDGRRLEGVLALRINGRYLKLVPVQ